MLKDREIIIGVSGGIAAYKIAQTLSGHPVGPTTCLKLCPIRSE